MSPSSSIPGFYRVFFQSIDPLVATSAIYVNLFDLDTALGSVFPTSHPYFALTPLHDFILNQLNGAFLTIIFLQVVLLRYTNDIGIWKIFEASILLMDFAVFYSVWVALGAQNRLQLDAIRGEEWGYIGITAIVALIRALFLVNVGFSEAATERKKKR